MTKDTPELSLCEQADQVSSNSVPVDAEPEEVVYLLPTSLGQERFWALDRMNPGNPTWNLPVRFRLQGALKPAFVERAFDEIVRRHEVLRTTFRLVDGQPAQVIAPSLKIELPVIDLRHLSGSDLDAEIDRISIEEAHRRFDLTKGPLLRVGLLNAREDEHVLLVTPHHSVADYWSIGLISNELGALYEAYYRGLESPLCELPIQYGDFAVWQREQSQGEIIQKEMSYWKTQLEHLPLVSFPTDRPRPAFPTYNATITSLLLPVELTDAIRDIANRRGATFFNTMLTAFSLLLHQYTGQTDIGVATQVAGRTSVELEGLIGLFINTVVLRTDLSGDLTFAELMSRAQEVSARSIVNQNLRFEQLLKELRPQDYPSHHTLFRINFICQRDPVKPLEFAGIKLTVIPSKSQGALYDLNVFLVLRAEGWRLACEYNTDLFEAATITRLLENYRALMERIAADPERRISEFAGIKMIPPTRERQASLELALASPESQTQPGKDRADLPIGPSAELGSNLIAATSEEETYTFPITIVQQRFWLLEQLMPGNPALNMQIALRLNGALDTGTLERCLGELVRRHEMLRTTFTLLDGQPVQVIHQSIELKVRFVDLLELSESDRERESHRFLHQEASQPFALATGPLLRATLLQLAADHHLLMITMPHIVCDGWSNGILIRELTVLYEAYREGRHALLAEPSIQYADFSHWQNKWLEDGSFEEDLRFWKQQLQGRLPLLNLPADRPASPALVSQAGMETMALPSEIVIALKDFCKREEITMFMLFLAVFKVLLYRYTGEEDILVGSPVAGRTQETEAVVGLFSYPISLRTRVSGDLSFRELARRVRDITVDALAHKDLPFGRLLEKIEIEQVRGRNPLFQFYFLHQVAFVQPVQTRDLSWTPLTWVSPGTVFDLHLATLERPDGVVARLEYNAEMFDASTIMRMLGHFRTILDAIVSNPELHISEIPILTPAEIQLTSPTEKNRAAESTDAPSVLEMFEDHARRTPNAIAAISAAGKHSYHELERWASELAVCLSNCELGPQKIVGICSDFSPDMMLAALGALKAGATYLWFPPEWESKEFLWRSVANRVRLVVTHKHLQQPFLDRGLKVVTLESATSNDRGTKPDPASRNVGPTSLACIRFTSGATGDPKAVLITNRALRARVYSGMEAYGLMEEDRVALVDSGARVEAMLSALASGAVAVFVPPEVLGSASKFLRFVAKHKCSVLIISTRLWQQMVFKCLAHKASLPGCVRLVVVHGERPARTALSAFQRFTKGSVCWMSSYGTTETGTTTAVYEPSRDTELNAAQSPVTLGVSAPGVWVHLLDRHLNPAPIGIPAEICVQGEGLAQGYLNGNTLEESRFVSVAGAGRIFRTGDLGRYLPDGSIEFLGPLDRYLTLMGYHFNPCELEADLLRHPVVREAVIVPSEGTSGVQRPIAYLVIDTSKAGQRTPERDPSLRRQLREFLATNARDYQKELGIVFVNELEIDTDGRPYLRALPPADGDLPFDRERVAPRNALESELVKIWEEILQVCPLGVTDNFFDLNGHSLLALRLFQRIKATWGKNLPLSTLFQAPTIERLAEILKQDAWSPPSSSLVAIKPAGSRPALFIISGLGGNVIRFNELARHLDLEQPVYALQPPGLDGSNPYLTRLEDMAAHYVREIKQHQSAGPYFLAGYSFGGLVTFEMGRQFAARGDEVGLLALLDAPEWHHQCATTKTRNKRDPWRAYRERLRNIVHGPQRLAYLRDRLRRHSSKLLYKLYTKVGRSLPQSFGTINDINSFAAAEYIPRPYGGRLTVFRTMNNFRPDLDDYELGWGSLAAGGVEVHEIPGEHLDITSEPNVQTLAAKLRACLSQAQGSNEKTPDRQRTRRHAPDAAPLEQRNPDSCVAPQVAHMGVANG